MNERVLRKKILKQVRDFYRVNGRQKPFKPGETPIPYAGRVYNHDEMMLLVDASLDFWLTAGRYAAQLEKDLARYLGLRFCLLTNSGSSANLLAVSALTSPLLKERQLKPGDEVITLACGFPTTVNPIFQNGLVPVFVDVGLGDYNIRVEQLEQAVSPKTKAIMFAHTLGNPANLNEITAFVRKHNLWFIEDCCDALGSRYAGKPVGTFGHLATLSFYPAHHITMGEGGAVLTDDPLLKRIVASFRDWGRDCWCDPGKANTCGKRFEWQQGDLPYGYDHKYIFSHVGYNLKVTDMQAAVGVAQLKKLEKFRRARQKNFGVIYRHLKDFQDFFLLPQSLPGSEPNWFGFPILVKENCPMNRDQIVGFLENRKIATRMLFGGNLTKQPAYRGLNYRVAAELVNTDRIMDRLFWIGVYPGLTKKHLDFVCRSFSEMLKSSSKMKKRVSR